MSRREQRKQPPPPPPPRGVGPALVIAAAAGAVGLLAGLLLRRRAGDAAAEEDVAAADAPAEPAPVHLAWRGLRCTLRRKPKGGDAGSPTPLLQDVSGSAAPGRLLAILGPSGAGKTTLLNALAGQVPRAAGLSLSGAVSVNGGAPAWAAAGRDAAPAPRQGYVTQDDAFFAHDTVLETLTLAAQLRLPSALPAARKDALVHALIAQLGLARVARTRVGDAKTRGISGGERKRLAIACELLASPSLLFLDEPTSGLDSFSALAVMQALQALARRGHTLVTSIHQPGGAIWALFDDVVLLAEGGRVLYSGAAAGALPHFAAAGMPCPPGSNPAEFLADVAAVDYSSPEAEAASRARVDALVAAWAKKGGGSSSGASLTVVAAPAAAAAAATPRGLPLWRQFRLLFARAWRQATRDTSALRARLASSLSSAAVFAAVFWRLDDSQAAIQSRLGLLQVCCVNAAMSSLIKTLQLFPKERVVVSRERANAHYAVAPYLAAKLAAELPVGAVFPALFGAAVYPCCGLRAGVAPFLRFMGVLTLESFSASAFGMTVSAMVPTAQAALAVGPALMVIAIVFGGSYVNKETVPKPLRWLSSVSLIKHAFEALCLNELRGARFIATQPGDAATGEQVLRRCAFQDSRMHRTLAAQAALCAGNWGATYVLLVRRKPRFAPLQPPADALRMPRRVRTLSDDAAGRAPGASGTMRMEPERGGVSPSVDPSPRTPLTLPLEAEKAAASVEAQAEV